MVFLSQIPQLGGQEASIVHLTYVWDNGLFLDLTTESRPENDSEGASFAPRFPRPCGLWGEAILRPGKIKAEPKN